VARQQVNDLRWDLGRAETEVERLARLRSEDAATMDRLRSEWSAVRRERDEAQDRVRWSGQELERTRAELAAWAVELAELSWAAVAVTSFVFRAGPNGSSSANSLARVPDIMRRSLTEGMRFGSYLTLMSAGGLYENLDLEAISQGCPSVRTPEEMAALDQAARECARIIVSRVPADAALEAVRDSEPSPKDPLEDGGDNKEAP
jgi:hypothetical protein